MRAALVHDYLNEYGGAERVLEALCEIWPKAPIYTAFVNKGSPAYKRFKGKKIITSWAQNIPFFSTRLYSPLRFLAPKIWNSFAGQLADYDLVITSASWFITKGLVNQKPETRNQKPIEVCYCHTPPRYLYGYATASDAKRNFLIRTYALIVNHFMRIYDFEAAQRVDYFIANSKEVQARIKKFYRRDSAVIYPPAFAEASAGKPLDISGFSEGKRLGSSSKKSLYPNSLDPKPYFLVVSRLVASKNVDIIVEVCAKLGLPLKVVGTGREINSLKKIPDKYSSSDPAPLRGSREVTTKNIINSGESSRLFDKTQSKQARIKGSIEFLGDVSDQELVEFYQNCRAVIFAASQEDFGIVPVEAMAAGKPVIANAEGGVLESVIDWSKGGKGKCTGVYFDPPTAGSLTLAINNFMDLQKKNYFDPKFIKKHAQKFSKDRFKLEILKFVNSKLK